jgi:hypothetical protein
MKKVTYFISIAFIFLSCDKDNNYVDPALQLDGKYELVSLESNIMMDLNKDNVYSTDFKDELSSYFESTNYLSDLEINRIYNHGSLFDLRINLPRVSAYPQYGYNEADYNRLSFIPPVITLNAMWTNIISFDYYDLNIQMELDERFSILTAIENEGTTIKTETIQYFFDEDDLTFKLVTLKGVYTKL